MTDYGFQGPFSRGDRVLEQYVVTRLLGMGGHAYVYECQDQFLDELLAIKVIPNPPNRGRDLLDRARAEAQLLRRLSHPNVVRMHTAAAIGDEMVCLVMEKLQGVTLRHLLALLGRLSLFEAATIVRQIAIGVAAAHELNVVHRDIKPDNVFVLPPNNHVKVLDFGIAKFLGHGLQTSNKYRFQGTPLYMSPEHLRGAGVTVRSDVYQLGTVLFELIAGVNPNLIDLQDPGFEQVAFIQMTRPTPSLLRIDANLPTELDALVQRATAKTPDERFGTMLEFVEHLDRLMHVYCVNQPSEMRRIRFVDEALVHAARELAAREAARDGNGAADAFAPTELQRVSTAAYPSPVAANPDAATGPAALPAQTERRASFHPVPNAVAHARIAIPKAARLPNMSTPVAQPKPSISLGFVTKALGFGVLLGLVLLWLLPRNDGVTPASTPFAAVSAASATSALQVAQLAPSVATPIQSAHAIVQPQRPSGPNRSQSAAHNSVKSGPDNSVVTVPEPPPVPSTSAVTPTPTAPTEPPTRARTLTGNPFGEEGAEGK